MEVTVHGDAMEPQLSAGDMVLVDTSQASVPNDGVHVLRVDGSIQLRRLQRLPGKEIEASSANAAYASFRFGIGGTGVAIIGRVV